MTNTMATELIPVTREEDIPKSMSETEEQQFWATHSVSGALLESFGPPPSGPLRARPRTKPVAIRFDSDTLARLKSVAKKKHKGYQTLLKEFVAERLYEEEKREGILPAAK